MPENAIKYRFAVQQEIIRKFIRELSEPLETQCFRVLLCPGKLSEYVGNYQTRPPPATLDTVQIIVYNLYINLIETWGGLEMDDNGIVLLVEDDKEILRINRRILEKEGFTVLCAESLCEARQKLAGQSPDVLVLDIMLPDGSGLDFCREVQGFTVSPVLFLTALDENHEIVEGLAAGGSDYITKPYDMEQFVARVKSHLRLARMNQRAAEQAKTLVRGPLTLEMVSGRAYLNGTDLLFNAKEFALLRFLIQNEGTTFSKEALYEAVWNLPVIHDARVIKSHLSRVRVRLQGSGYTIETVRGVGYRFGPVK